MYSLVRQQVMLGSKHVPYAPRLVLTGSAVGPPMRRAGSAIRTDPGALPRRLRAASALLLLALVLAGCAPALSVVAAPPTVLPRAPGAGANSTAGATASPAAASQRAAAAPAASATPISASVAPTPRQPIPSPAVAPSTASTPTTAMARPTASPMPTSLTATPAARDDPPAAEAPPSLETIWSRLRTLMFAPVLQNLQPLPRNERDDPFFAVNAALQAGDATVPIMRGVGADLDRLELRWDMLEPTPGDFQFGQIDYLMTTAGRMDLPVLAVVDGTPAWAAADQAPPGAAVPVGLDEPAFLADGQPNPANTWASFLAVLARRYGVRIAAWEIWNEPNSQAFWRGSPTEYARLLTVSDEVLARTAPDAPVLVGGMVDDDGGFFKRLVQATCPQLACPPLALHDIAWHVYDNPADIPRVAAFTRATLQPYGVTPAVWITEANVPVDDPDAPADAVAGPDAVSLDRQAAFVLQAFTLARGADVKALAIYRASDVDDQGRYWGLLRGDWTARPALLAYRTAAQWLSHTTAGGVQHPQPGLTVATFCRPGATVAVAWNDNPAPVALAIPASGSQATLIQMDGKTSSVPVTNGAVHLEFPAAAPRTANTVPLGAPVLVSMPRGASNCPAYSGAPNAG